MPEAQSKSATEHVDVLIVGAGLSGIGTACHLKMRHPGRSVAIVESRERNGGTWDLFRYPGIRSDSDMFTLGYSFRPWTAEKSIAGADTILDYIRDTSRAYGIEDLIRYQRRAVSAHWSTADASWTVDIERSDGGGPERISCNFLFACTGYYRYDEGYSPAFPGAEDFEGDIVHPQLWPEDLDYEDKRVVVIGSGATAVTLIPAMADEAAHVTMLQRSPTYIVSMPSRDRIADFLRRHLPARTAHWLTRWKSVLLQWASYQFSRRRPEAMKRLIRKGLVNELPHGYEVDTHFSPSYDPWDQRLCLVPDGDLFKAIGRGDASIVTDTIDRITPEGIRLSSGETLEADVIVTATGLNLLALGGMELTVDGEPVDIPKLVGYKGLMFSGVPNFAATLGYSNASWTLKCDLVAVYVCRLLEHMDRTGTRIATPRWNDGELPDEPFLDLKSGYVLRAIGDLPKQGPETPWRLHQNYARDLVLLKHRPVEDEALSFS